MERGAATVFSSVFAALQFAEFPVVTGVVLLPLLLAGICR